MLIAAYVIAAVVGAGIIFVGFRFLLVPDDATRDFGVAPRNARALTAIKGDRDIAAGLVTGAVWLGSGHVALGWALIAFAVAPIGDATIVLTNGGSRRAALGIHGLTALLMVLAGLVLVTH